MKTDRVLPTGGDYILGLDIGANSVGWAVLDATWHAAELRWVPTAIRAAGSRVFEPGVDNYNQKKEASKAKSRRDARSMRRRLRRHQMRLRRLYDLLADSGMLPVLQRSRTQPEAHSVLRDRALKALDKRLLANLRSALPVWVREPDPAERERLEQDYLHNLKHRWLYELRSRALTQALDPEALGRCIYHLAERRGFKSNRKVNKSSELEEAKAQEASPAASLGVAIANPAPDSTGASAPRERRIGMLDQIRTLRAEIGEGRTLGQHYAEFKPTDVELPSAGATPRSFRIRGRFTSREMYEAEFQAIWDAQIAHGNTSLTPELRTEIQDTLFHQRPLRSMRHLIGRCELIPSQKRTERGTLENQQLRLYQRLNDVRVLEAFGQSRSLTGGEREALLRALETRGARTRLTKTEVCKLLGAEFKAQKGRFPTINLGESEDGKKETTALLGNDTANAMRAIFDGRRGPAWDELASEKQDAIVDCLLGDQADEELLRLAIDDFGLDAEAAEEYANTSLDDKPGQFSREALRRLLPHLKLGKPLSTAIVQEFGQRTEQLPMLDLLPPLIPSKPPHWKSHPELRVEWKANVAAYPNYVPPELRNPVVQRAVTELRKVVNALIRRFGKPTEIALEYARELKQPLEVRLTDTSRMREAEARRQQVVEAFAGELGVRLDATNPRDRAVIDKYLLAKSQDFTCPYSGRRASMAEVLGPEFEIDHVIPRSRWPNNEWKNKVFCSVEANRRKGNRAPSEVFHGEEWDRVCERINSWLRLPCNKDRTKALEVKIRLFRTPPEGLQELIDGWTARQLSDTAYAARVARRFLGHLYGCLGDTGDLPPSGDGRPGRKVVRVLQGGVTAEVRKALQLNRILSDTDEKSRADHRHHAVDAVVIAMTSQATVALINSLNATVRRDKASREEVTSKIVENIPGFMAQIEDVIREIHTSHRADRAVTGALHKESIYSLRDRQGRKPQTPEEAADTERFCYVASRTKVTDLKNLDDILNQGTRAAIESVLRDQLHISLTDKKGVEKGLAKLTGPLTPMLTAKQTGLLVPVKSVVILRKENTRAIGTGHRVRYMSADPNHHLEIFRIVEGADKGNWTGRMVKTIDAYARVNTRKRAGRKPALFVENRPELWIPGTELVCELCKGDTVLLTVDGQRRLFLVRKMSLPNLRQLDIVFDELNDGRKEADREDSKIRLRSWNAMAKANPVRVLVTPDGCITLPKPEREAPNA